MRSSPIKRNLMRAHLHIKVILLCLISQSRIPEIRCLPNPPIAHWIKRDFSIKFWIYWLITKEKVFWPFSVFIKNKNLPERETTLTECFWKFWKTVIFNSFSACFLCIYCYLFRTWAIRHFHKHTKLAIIALMQTLHSHIFAVSSIICTIWC